MDAANLDEKEMRLLRNVCRTSNDFMLACLLPENEAEWGGALDRLIAGDLVEPVSLEGSTARYATATDKGRVLLRLLDA